MRPGNCSGSYSEPPRAREIALRSSSCPREVDATTFSIRNLTMGKPPGPGMGQTGALLGYGTQAVPYMVPCPRGPSWEAKTASTRGRRAPRSIPGAVPRTSGENYQKREGKGWDSNG